MSKRQTLPAALTIAGSDSGGGAGIQADLKTFAALGVHGTSAITCVTAQNPRAVSAIEPCKAAIVRAQIEAVFAALPPDAVKTGMLYSAAVVREVVRVFEGRDKPPLIVDPVLVATSGRPLLQPAALKLLKDSLLPLCLLVTPNLAEAEMLTGQSIRSVEDMRAAAQAIHSRHGCAALVKGGHLKGLKEAVDIFFDGKTELLLTAPFIGGLKTHGTGCTYSAAIAAHCALGLGLPSAVEKAKQYISRAISLSARVAGHDVLRWN